MDPNEEPTTDLCCGIYWSQCLLAHMHYILRKSLKSTNINEHVYWSLPENKSSQVKSEFNTYVNRTRW